MTTEEKAKAYDEALERARKKYNSKYHPNEGPSGAYLNNTDLEEIFPKLRESGDEKIMDALLEYFGEQCDMSDVNGFYAYEIYDWLKKQKEQNSDTEEYTDFTIYRPLKNGKGEYEFIPYSFYDLLTSFSENKDLIDFLHTCFYTKEECEEWIKKQKEQKPAEWRPYDKETLAKIKELIDAHFPEHEQREVFKSWLDEHISQPAKWDEEDEKFFRTALWHISYSVSNGDTTDCYCDTTNWLKGVKERLKYLCPQHQWKPSEQEKGALRTAIYILTNERNFPKAAAHLQNILDAFNGEKSRKDWKPSEEQMEALKFLVKYVAPSEKFIVVIKNLYDDLKKL